MKRSYRTVVHVSALLIPLFAEASSKTIVLASLIAITACYILSESLRLMGKQLPVITGFTLKMSRVGESEHFIAQPVFLAVGTILSLILFPKNIAYASIAIVAVGDPVATHVGGKFGQRCIGRKTLEGFAAGLVASFAAASVWVSLDLAVVGSVTGMLLELLGTLEDNLTMPLGAGSTIVIARVL